MLDFRDVKVLVVGDVMLDKYYYGRVSRISPEAPVPVVHVRDVRYVPGGSANVSNNIVNLKASSYLLGLVGMDDSYKVLNKLIESNGINPLLIQTDRPTITKARVIGEHQQIVRLDFEERFIIDDGIFERIKEKLTSIIGEVDIIVISDYAKGVLSDRVCRLIIEVADKNKKMVIVDPKGKEWNKYSDAFMITPNFKEFCDIIGRNIPNEDSTIEEHAGSLLDRYNINYLLITRSEKGMSLASRDEVVHIHSQAKEVYDVSGAGDTVVATLSVALAKGFDIKRAIRLANRAAGIVVSKMGTAPITIEELIEGFDKGEKIINRESIGFIADDLRAKGKRIVFTNGVFDILHRGHITYLKQARSLGDVLIVGLNSDSSVKRIKGKDRPINNQDDRAFLLANFDFIDFVVIFDEDTPYNLISLVKPDILVKGGDYKVEEVVGREFAGEVRILPFVKGYSTSNTIKNIKER